MSSATSSECPFCGDNRIVSTTDHGSNWGEPKDSEWYVTEFQCLGCGAIMQFSRRCPDMDRSSAISATKEKAFFEFNRRAVEDRLRSMLLRLVKQATSYVGIPNGLDAICKEAREMLGEEAE